TESTDDLWTQTRDVAKPVLAKAATALRNDRRLLALSRLSAVRSALAAWTYVNEQPADRRNDAQALEAEWARVGELLRAEIAAPAPDALDGVTPALVRAEAEAALPQIRAYYASSLDYGRSTLPQYGFVYLGTARAQSDFVRFCRSLSTAAPPAPPLRSLRPELTALENDLLAAYRPPAAIDRHGEFVVAHSTLKEAFDLEAASLRRGALLRYLEAAMRVAPLRSATRAPLDAAGLASKLRDFDA